MKKLILISGKAENGKDAFSDILMKKLEGKSCKVALARDLKYICKDYLGWDGTKSIEGREILQQIGTDKIRNEMGWDIFHAQRVYETVKIIEDYYDYIFVTDCRFRNELNYLSSRFPDKTLSIRINRLNFTSTLTKEQLAHKSECDLDEYKGFDYFIESEGGLDNLEKMIDKTMGEFLENQVELNEKDYVIVKDIANKNKASHLLGYIGRKGYVYFKQRSEDGVKYKIMFDTETHETCYLKREELQLIKNKLIKEI